MIERTVEFILRHINSETPQIFIAGATAAGKTETAVRLAERLNGEVISADSMQVYRYMDIGTAKPGPDDMRGIRHYLISELDPCDDYSVFIFQRMAQAYADEIRSRGKLPIICGGTGFYINALINGVEFAETERDTEYRNELFEKARQNGNAYVHRLLAEVDPESALAIHENNIRRVVRALEFYKQTGGKISAHNLAERAKRRKSPGMFILNMDRQAIYKRIDTRVDKMMQAGLENEVRGLLDMGYHDSLTSMQGLGYKEMVRYIQGQCGLSEAVDSIKTGTRHFAKRQLTWFKYQCDGVWVEMDQI